MAAILANYAYAEGFWTPTISCATTAPTGVTYATQVGRFTRIGNIVIAGVNLKLSSKGTGGAGIAVVVGLPIPPIIDQPVFLCPVEGDGFTITGTSTVYLIPQEGVQIAYIAMSNVAVGTIILDYTNLTDASHINGQIIYNVVT